MLSLVSRGRKSGWSGKRDSNPRPPAWKAGALPLSYSRLPSRRAFARANTWWGEEDSNLRRRSSADLQSAPFGRLGISPLAPQTVPPVCNRLISLALAGGFEPPTHCLQGSCSTPELRQQSQNFTLVSRPFQVKTFLLETFRQGPGRLLWSPAGAKLRSRERPPRPRRSTTRSSLS